MLWWLAMSLLALPAQAPPVQEKTQIKIYNVPMTEYDATAEVVRGLLSPEGRLAEDRPNFRLIVDERPSVHEKIAAALGQVRVPPRNIRIRVTSNAIRTENKEGVEVAGSTSRKGVTVRAGEPLPPSTVEVKGGSDTIRTRAASQQEILVVSGGRAAISVTEAVPYKEWFWTWGQANGLWAASTIAWTEVGSSLVVQPTLQADGKLCVRLTPSFSYFLDRERLETQVTQLTTEVCGAPGEEIDLGGIPIRDREFLEHFLTGYGKTGEQERMQISLKATVE